MKFSLVIPCYNEVASLPALLERCAAVLRQPDTEVVLVDNGSTDDSADVLARLLPGHAGARVVRVERNQGYGYGILCGLRAARGGILGWTHADLQTDPADTIAALAAFDQHGPQAFVKGLRWGRPIADRLFTLGMSAFETLLLGQPMRDINAQPTLFSRSFFESWVEPPHDFSLDLYAYYQARRSGLAVCRIPVRFGPRAHGLSHWNVNWSAKRRFIRRTVDYSLQLRKSVKP